MSEIEPLFEEMLATLRQARQVIEGKLQAFEGTSFLDRDSLAQIEEAARTFEEQADSLAEIMTSQGASLMLIDAAEDLFYFFRGIEERVEGCSRRARGEAEVARRA